MIHKVELGDKLLKVGKHYKYLTNGKIYKVVHVNSRNISVIDDENEELTITPDFYYKRLRKIYEV